MTCTKKGCHRRARFYRPYTKPGCGYCTRHFKKHMVKLRRLMGITSNRRPNWQENPERWDWGLLETWKPFPRILHGRVA